MSEQRKNEKKRKRFAARLFSTKGIVCSDKPKPNVILCNVGQATGFNKNKLEYILIVSRLDLEPKYIAESGESYSYLAFETTEDAKLFYDTCNGKAEVDDFGILLYAAYVDSVPNTDKICKHPNPNGLILIPNFITEDEERSFLKVFDIEPSETALKNRQVKHYGYVFRYGTNDVDLDNPLDEKIPDICNMLWKRLQDHGYDVGVPTQLTVNKYMPGQGIPSHVDKHSPFGENILVLSLGSNVVMDWSHHSGPHVPVVVEARSMMIMSDEARYDWQHGIQPRTWDPVVEHRKIDDQLVKVITSETKKRGMRISLTFRWPRTGPCTCRYKTLCDGTKWCLPETISSDVADRLEDLHVHQVYEEIAGHFSTTRHKPWPRVVEFMQHVPSGAVLLDLGCGNGKNVLHRKDILQLACERSDALLRECKVAVRNTSVADCVRMDLLHSPIKPECADYAICIAVIHHFSSHSRRREAITTIRNLLRPNGQALITVWAQDQSGSNYLSKTTSPSNEQTTQAFEDLELPVHKNRTQFQHKDLLVPWKLRKKTIPNAPECTFLRYYHVFEQGELDSLCQEAGLLVIRSFYEEGNWCVVCMKV